MIEGISKDEPIVENEFGAKQSRTLYAFHRIPNKALFELAKVTEEGEKKYGRYNWLSISTDDHLNHALQHIFAYLAGDSQDDHLSHAVCRIMFALEIDIEGKEAMKKYVESTRQ
jgi:hypothetical protein